MRKDTLQSSAFWTFNGLAQIFCSESNKGKNERRANKINRAREYTQNIKIRAEKRK